MQAWLLILPDPHRLAASTLRERKGSTLQQAFPSQTPPHYVSKTEGGQAFGFIPIPH